MTNQRYFELFFSVVLLIFVCGCGGGGSTDVMPTPAKADFVYALTATSQPPSLSFQISSLKVDASTASLGTPVTTTLSVPLIPAIAVDQGSKFLYASQPLPGQDSIGIFTIDPNTGVPTETGVFLLTTICALCPPPSDPGDLALASNGKDLYYGSATFGPVTQGIGSLSVNNGTLNIVTGSPFPVDPVPFRLGMQPTGKFIYAENLDPSGASGNTLQTISGFAIDADTGALTAIPQAPIPPPMPATVTGFEFHPSGSFLYSGTGMSANGVMGWSIDSTTGNLTDLLGSPFQVGTEAFAGVMVPSGKFLYLSAGPAGGINGFSVDSTSGMLTLLTGSPFVPGTIFGAPAVDPSGQFLFIQDSGDALEALKIDSSSGALTAIGSPMPITGRAISLTVVRAP